MVLANAFLTWPTSLSWSANDTVSLKLTAPATATKPAKPTGLTATAGNAQVVLDWANPSDSTITKYQYRQRTGSTWGSWTDIANSAPGETNATSYTVTSLMNGTAYRFRIRAVNAGGNGAQSDVAGPVTPAAAVWSATLTVDAASAYKGCGTTGLDACSTALTEDQFTHGSTTYTVTRLSTLGATDLSLVFATATGTAAKSALGSLTLTLGGSSYAVSASTASSNGLTWTSPPSWSDGDTVAVSLARGGTTTTTDTTGPTIASLAVTSTGSYDPFYSTGDVVEVTVTFNEAIVVTGTPRLVVKIGSANRNASCIRDATPFKTLNCAYTIVDGDEDTDGVEVEANKLTLNGGTIKDASNNDAVLTHIALTAQSAHKVDAVPPSITGLSITTTPANSVAYKAGETITVRATFDETVTIDDDISLALQVGGNARTLTNTATPDGVTTVDFSYTVASGDLDLDGVSVAAGSLTITDSADLYDARDNTASSSLAHSGLATQSGHKVDGVAPTISSYAIATTPRSGGTYTARQAIAVRVTFSEAVTVAGGNPSLKLQVGSSEKAMGYNSGSGTAVLEFLYTVASGDTDTDGVSVGADKLTLPSGGTIRDAADNDAVLTSTGMAAQSGHKVDTTAPAAPTGLAATAGNAQVVLGWTNPSDASIGKYQVQQKEGTNAWGSWTDIAGSGAATIAHTATGLKNGTEYKFKIRAVDAGGNVGAESAEATATPAGPVVPAVSTLAITSTANSFGFYKAADSIAVTLTFSEAITVTGAPRLKIDIGGTEKNASCARKGATGDDAKKLVCTYTVASGDNDSDGVTVGANKLTLNSGTIKDSDSNDATLTHAALPADDDHRVDTTAPTIAGLAIFTNSGAYGIGDEIIIEATFSEGVDVTGVPTLAVDIGGTIRNATYTTSGSGGSGARFEYTVQAGDLDTDGISIASGSLVLPTGASILDIAGNAATLSHSGLATQSGHTVDGTRPSVAFDSATPTVGVDYTITLTDTGSKVAKYAVVEVAGTATAATGCDDPSADSFSTTAVSPAASPHAVSHSPATAGRKLCVYAEDAAGNGTSSLHGTAIAAAPTVPTVTTLAITSSPPSGSGGWYEVGNTVKVELTFDEIITVTGAPALEITVGSAAKSASCARKGSSGDDRKKLVCSYTVVNDDEDTDGISVAANKLTLPSGATIKDSDSNDASRAHSALPAQSGHKVDAKAPTIMVGAPDPSGPAKSKTVAVTVSDSGVGFIGTAGAVYWFVPAATTCNAAAYAAAGFPATTVETGSSITINSESRNGRYLCFLATDRRGNRAYAKSAEITGIDTTDPTITFPSGVTPAVGVSYTITLTDTGSKVAKYAVVEVAGTETTAAGCDDPSADSFSTTAVSPAASPHAVSHSPATEGRKLCVYAEDAAGNETSSLHGTAIAAAPTVPTVTTLAITSTANSNGYYKATDSIKVTLTFSEAITVTGAPRLKIDIGGTEKNASCARKGATGDDAKQLVCSYTVASGDNDSDGVTVGANKLSLNGGTIKDGDDNNATLTHAALPGQSSHKVDTTAPTVSSVAVTSTPNDAGYYKAGDRFEVRFTFSEVVMASGTVSDFTVTVGPTDRTAPCFVNRNEPPSNMLDCNVVILAAHGDDHDGISVGANSLALNTGSIRDAAGNAADLAHDALGTQSGHKVDTTAPAAPSSLAATAGNAQVVLTWNDPGDASIVKYRYKQKSGGGSYPATWTDISGSDATTVRHVVTSLANGTAYSFKIQAVDAGDNEGAESEEKSATPTADAVRPAQPSGLAATAGDRSVTLRWTDPQDASIVKYQVRQGTGAWTDIADSGASTVSHTVGGLVNGTAYTFRIRAVDGGGAGEASAAVTATPADTVRPAAPSGLAATAGDRSVTLRWTDPQDASIVKYQVRYRAGDGAWGAWSDIAGSGASTVSHTVTGLANGTAYGFQVRALDAVGAGAAQATPAPSTPEPPPPGAPPAPGKHKVAMNWPLLPGDFGSGKKFRLLFVTSTRTSATSADIRTYNRLVQARAGANANLAEFSGDFRALISTATADARDNTDTNAMNTDPYVPVYWLGGEKVADDYADFYDGTWDSVAWKSESGATPVFATSQVNREVWTGSKADGTKHADHAGKSDGRVRYGWLGGQLLSDNTPGVSRSLPLYALSPVLTVGDHKTVLGYDLRSFRVLRGEEAGQLAVSWKVRGDPGHCGYVVEWRPAGSEGSWERHGFSTYSRAVSHTIEGLESGTSYEVRLWVRAPHVDQADELAFERTATTAGTRNAPPAGSEPPAAPGTLAARALSASTVGLTWEAPAQAAARAPVTGYEVRRSADAGASFGAWAATGSARTAHVAEGLSPGASYTFEVRATSAAGAGPASNRASAETLVSAPPAALSARVVDAPAEHMGRGTAFTVRIGFSAPVRLGAKSVQVEGGRATGTSRVDKRRDLWDVRVKANRHRAVTLTLPVASDCAAAGAVCADGRPLTAALTLTVSGPAALRVADARAREGKDAAIDFRVTLDRAAAGPVTVDYATEDGTATAGEDYTAASGTLSFAVGETEKTVSVAVLDDAHDEGRETFSLVLSNVRGARIADGRAKGIIRNDDRMPKAWLGRFGRTVTGQVLDVVQARLAAPREAGAQASLAGQPLPSWAPGAANDDAVPEAASAEDAGDRAALAAMGAWLAQAGPDGRRTGRDGGLHYESRALSGRELFTGTSFALTGGTAGGGGYASLWGRGAITGFDGREGALSLDGEVATGLLGADYASGRWTVGLGVGHSRGTGGYREGGACTESLCAGEVEAVLTGVYPYAGLTLTERVSAWAAAGYGSGELELRPEGRKAMTADLTMAMGAAGMRGEVLRPDDGDGLALAVKGDARFTRTTSAKAKEGGMEAAQADVWLLRAGVEGSRRFALGGGEDGATLTPSFEVGARLDGGDAEEGFGADVGGGVAFADPGSGLTLDLRARGLLAHEASGFREWGASAGLVFDPRPSTARGLSLTLTRSWGAAPAGGMDALLSRETLAGLAANDEGGAGFDAASRLEGEVGYGMALFGGGFTGTPNVGFGLSDTAREVRMGWRVSPAGGGGFEFNLDAARRDSAGDTPEHRIGFGVTARW